MRLGPSERKVLEYVLGSGVEAVTPDAVGAALWHGTPENDTPACRLAWARRVLNSLARKGLLRSVGRNPTRYYLA